MKTDSQIIDELGGNKAVAELCNPTISAVVSGWRKRGIPSGWRAYLKTQCPDVFSFENEVRNKEIEIKPASMRSTSSERAA